MESENQNNTSCESSTSRIKRALFDRSNAIFSAYIVGAETAPILLGREAPIEPALAVGIYVGGIAVNTAYRYITSPDQ